MAVLLAHQAVANPATIVGTPLKLDVHGTHEVLIECYHAFNEATINTDPQSFLIQTSLSSSGNDDWVTPLPFTAFNGTPVIEALNVSAVVGDTALEVVDVAGFAAEDLIYIRDTVATDSEWAYVQEVDNVPTEFVHLLDGLTKAHADTTTSLFSNAEKFAARLNVQSVQRIRAVYFNEGGTAADTHLKAEIELIAR